MKSEGQKILNVLKRSLLVFTVLAMSFASQAQNLAQHNWYFGNSTNAIRFNRSTNLPFTVTDKAIPFGTGGSAVATDPSTADLLFYTDGSNVYNAFHQVMSNGTGLSANISANQPVVISAVPGDSTKYFIFTNTANYTTGGSIAVSIVDMTIFGGAAVGQPPLGGVVNPKNVAVAGLSNRSEGMIVVPHANGTDYWLITHQNGSQNYSATLINKASYTAGTFTTVATLGLALPTSVANFSYSKKLKKLAVSAQDSKTDAILLTFDDATGVLTFNPATDYILNSGMTTVNPQNIYDIQWDNAGQYLYISRVGEPGVQADVLQYDYINQTTTLTSVLKAPIFRSWGLQLAPDSAIYHIYQAIAGGPFLVEKFTKTDTIASSVIQTPLPFGAINFSGTQFPAFLPKTSSTLTLSFTTSTPLCENSNITFFPNVFPNADSLHWDFADTTSVTDWSPVHKFKQNRTYNVTLTAYYQGKTQTVTQPLAINSFLLKLQLVADTTACHCQLPVNKISCGMPQFSVKAKATGGTPTFTWSNGQTGATLKPDSAGYYYVVATDGGGCSTYAGVTVKEYGKTDQRSNIWYFGNKAGIDFNKQPPLPLNTSAMDAPAGCAIMCDRNGQAIFYTDGDQVWDKTNTSIASGIGGNPGSTQSALIIPVPGDETLYYIFTTQAISNPSGAEELRYSLFDLKQNGGKGAIVQKNILLFARSTERITGNNQWLVAHEYGNNTFRTYKISTQGIGDPVYSAIGSVHSFQFAANGEGYMKLGPKNNLAVALSNPGTSNWVELFHLNDSTGVLSYYRKIDLNHPAGQVYGIEFSPGGNKLFASVMDTPNSDIFEYAIDSIGKPHLKKDNVEPGTIGAMQVAPDSRIYFAVNNSNSLGTFTADEDTTRITTGINVSGFGLAGGTNSTLGLPNFRQQVGIGFGGPGFTFTGLCLGDSTKFVGTPTDAIDQFQWFFGDGGTSTKSTPAHLYASAGTYTVFMKLTNRCGLDTTITKKVVISNAPKSTLPPASTICGAMVTLHTNTPSAGPYTYLWSTGATTESINVTQPTFLSVTNTDANGCKVTASGVVVDSRPKVALGPDFTVCQNNGVANLDAQNPGATYVWTITNVTAGTSVPGGTVQTQAVDTSVPGVFKYSVTVTDPITTCQTVAQKTFTVIQSPTFNMTGTNPTTCGATNGTISLTAITSPALYSYSVTGPVGSGFFKQGFDQSAATQGPFVTPLDGLIPAGTYSGIVIDQVSGCAISKTLGLTNAGFTVTPSVVSLCDPPIINIANNAGAGFFPLNYLVTNSSTGQTVSGTINSQTANFPIQLLTQGVGTTASYSIQITGGGCVITPPNFPVTTNAPAPLSIQSNLCTNPATLAASGGSGYTWTGPGIVGSTSGPTISINAGGTYQVTGTSGGCSISQSTTLTYNGPIVPAFTQSDACQNQVVLKAAPLGNYTYRWYENGSAAPTQVGQQITLTTADDGANFILELFDGQSGCTIQTASKPVQVVGPITASVTGPLVCDDGTPFTLTSSTGATTPPSPTYVWQLNGTTIAGATAATLTGQTSAGTYKVIISQAPTCSASATIPISKAAIPQGALPPVAIICSDPDNNDPKTMTVTLDPGYFNAYNWFKNTVPISPPHTTRTYIADSPGVYKVDLTNAIGCVNANTVNVINDCEPVVTGPNAFRPNSAANENKIFKLFTFFITDNFEVIVYDRWGEAVFESKDKKFQWNGGYKNNPNQPLPGGTYVYLVRYISTFHPDQGVQEQRGGVMLLR